MDYRETLNWLFSQLPMYQRVGGAAYKADLQKTIDLLNALGNPQEHFKAIHIAGTNGKGSVAHMVASVLQEAGHKTGLYTSPHLKDFRERIKINGEPVPREYVTGFVQKNKPVFQKLKPSFFEMTVAMAYSWFAAQKTEIAVLETGMGGRLDSTNICRPVVTAITNIGMDHTQFLGDTIEKIAREKAGIIKNNIPVVAGRHQPESDAVFREVAAARNAPLFFAEDDIDVRPLTGETPLQKYYDIWVGNDLIAERVSVPLSGNYQRENIAVAVKVLDILKKGTEFRVRTEDITEGLEQTVSNTGISGRWQVINTNPLAIADTGHNPDGIREVVNQLKEMNYNKLHFVLGMVDDKNHNEILELLPKDARYYFCTPQIPRGLDAEILGEKAAGHGLQGLTYPSVLYAYNSAVNNAGVNDMVFVGGSTFVVAEVV